MIIVMNGDTLGKNLSYLRKKYALSRRALANLSGAQEDVLKGIEDGSLSPELPIEVFQRMCQIFNLSPDDLAQVNLAFVKKP